MNYYLEMQFSDGRWQRNPNAFRTREEAELEGKRTVAQFSLQPGEFYSMPNIGYQTNYTGPKYRVVAG